jgi:hypothetical protein
MSGDTTDEELKLPSNMSSSLTGAMNGLGGESVLVVPGEKLVHLIFGRIPDVTIRQCV